MKTISRRESLRLLAAPIGLAALGPTRATLVRAAIGAQPGRLKVLVAGVHPDDPESGCGGTIARYAAAGHDVVVLHLTRGEAGIQGKSHADSATIRTAEAERACSILSAQPRFAGLRTGRTAALAYFEVLSGDQTQLFRPTDYVGISKVAARKREACFAHASQKPEEWYPAHERMSRFRGVEHGCEHAEAFIRHDRGPALPLPA